MSFITIKNDILEKHLYFDAMNNIYEIFTKEVFDKNIHIPIGFEDLVKIIYNVHQQEVPNISTYKITDTTITLNNNNKIMLAFSGGLDSVYECLRLQELGYDVILMHFKNLNKNIPKETEFAEAFASYIHVPIIIIDVTQPKQFYIDNAVKNQTILSYMIDYGIKYDIQNYSTGNNFADQPLSQGTIGQTITDSTEVFKYFFDGIRTYINNINFVGVEDNMTKYKELEYILHKDPTILKYVYSCINPHRFNNMLNQNNRTKYKVPLMDGRCGSCYKCCMEFILLSELGYYDKEQYKEYIKHCWDIISNSKCSSDTMKREFNKKIPNEIRLQRIKEIKA
jgi:7-cyano-7-deazaguanine synthase in queuosine biosynthesis